SAWRTPMITCTVCSPMSCGQLRIIFVERHLIRPDPSEHSIVRETAPPRQDNGSENFLKTCDNGVAEIGHEGLHRGRGRSAEGTLAVESRQALGRCSRFRRQALEGKTIGAGPHR